MGRHPHDWVGIRQAADQRPHDSGIGLGIRPPNSPGSRQGRGTPGLANIARAMSAPADKSRRGDESHLADPSANAHNPFPGLPRGRQTAWPTSRADVLSSKLVANSSESPQKRQCQSRTGRIYNNPSSPKHTLDDGFSSEFNDVSGNWRQLAERWLNAQRKP
jgi:hypothetical protein